MTLPEAPPGGDPTQDRLRIAVCHAQAPFTHGGAEMHMEGLVGALRRAGHEVDVITIPFRWYPPSELVHQMALWRSLDLSESNGLPIDMVVALKFPAYLVPHERKVVWLIHQHRTAYELWDHPDFADLSLHEDGPAVRDLIWNADRIALREAKRIFTNSGNVRDRLQGSLGIPGEPLYHRSGLAETLLEREPGPLGGDVIYPSRIEPLKRQSLVVEAMRHVKTDVRLVIVGTGPGARGLAAEVERLGLTDRVRLAGRLPDEDLIAAYLGALGVFYGPFDEDYGYVTLEAMASARPVVTTTDSGGPLELVRDGENGLVVEPEPGAIAEVLDHLYREREEAARLGAAGREHFVATVPPWSQVVAQLLR